MRPVPSLDLRLRRVAVAWIVAAVSCGPSGCDRGPSMAEVSGRVTLDGAPLDDAVIEFDAGDGTVPASIAVTQGKFAGSVLVGKKTLRFFAMRPSKPDPRLAPTDVQAPFENILPDRYGYDSQFTLDVTAEGHADLAYELETQSAGRDRR